LAGNPNWKDGKSGNPGGRPKIDPKIKKALEAACPKAVRVLISLLDSDEEDIRLKASNSILDRNLGKPAQAITDSSGNDIAGVVVYLPQK
jgi:hypothetical protein